MTLKTCEARQTKSDTDNTTRGSSELNPSLEFGQVGEGKNLQFHVFKSATFPDSFANLGAKIF